MRRAALIVVLGLLGTSAAAQQAPVSATLEAALGRAPSGRQPVWVYLRDKGRDAAPAGLSVRAQSRRALRGDARLIDPAQDREIPRAYLDALARSAGRVRAESRWLNAVSVEATRAEVAALAQLPFVARLDLVRGYRRARPEEAVPVVAASGRSQTATTHALDYGPSLTQLAQVNVPAVHDLGLHGEGVIVAVFDSGFDNLGHESLATMNIAARRDFVNGDDDVADGLDLGDGSHGTSTLSTLGGFREGSLVGPAFAASYVLAKTENTVSETPSEEDHWVAAAEWAEALGADVISSSLGYLVFDVPYPSYSAADMNGATAVTTLAAELAAARGVVVVNSAGNAGFNPAGNTLGAPADGRRVLSVGAVNSFGERAEFSSVGPTADGRIKPDVVAQGVVVLAAGSFGTDGYVLVNGTSFSCPLTAGVVALVLQAHPTYTVDQVLGVMRQTARNAAAPDNLIGWGLVDALAAVAAPAPAVKP